MVRLAFVSTAHIHTKNFLKKIGELEGCSVAAIWDDVAPRGQRYAEESGAVFLGELDDLLQAGDLDGFIICAENTRHLGLLEKVIPTGKPVFCEKPLVISRRDLAVVKKAEMQHGTPIISGYFQPFGSDLRGVSDAIENGVVGKVLRVRYRNAHHAAFGRWFDSSDLAWFTNPELSGGGALMDMGTHAVHAVLRMFGPISEVFATTRNFAGIYPDVEDHGMILCRFESGVEGVIEASWTQTGGSSGLEVVGEKSTVFRTDEGYVSQAPGESPCGIEAGEAQPTRVDRLVSVIRGEIPEVELEEDWKAICSAVEVMEAAYLSAESGHWVKV